MRYLVMKRGRKLGHTPLPYGEYVTAKSLGVKDADLQAFVARGVLRPTHDAPKPPPRRVSPDEAAQTGNKDD